MSRSKGAFTMLELMVTSSILAVVFVIILGVFTRGTSGVHKGMQTMGDYQDQSKLLAVLKQDFRTLIVNEQNAMSFEKDEFGLRKLDFKVVKMIDSLGRPVTSSVVYQRVDGDDSGRFSILREYDENSIVKTRYFLTNKVIAADLAFLKNNNQEITNFSTEAQELRKIRINLETEGSELFLSTLHIYSPYVAREFDSPAASVWRPNASIAPYSPVSTVGYYSAERISINSGQGAVDVLGKSTGIEQSGNTRIR